VTVSIGSMCSGYGGLDMGARAVLGGRIAWHCENDEDASKVLAAHHPGVPNLGDLTAVDWAAVEPVDIVTAGFPCQPFSAAGQQRGAQDERWLWDDIAHAVSILRPSIELLFDRMEAAA
jgi:DNA (cytosine-5)-methyltransferase 1